jgi:hypothetical protein
MNGQQVWIDVVSRSARPQDAAVAGFGEQPAEQGSEDGGDGGGAAAAQDQRPR